MPRAAAGALSSLHRPIWSLYRDLACELQQSTNVSQQLMMKGQLITSLLEKFWRFIMLCIDFLAELFRSRIASYETNLNDDKRPFATAQAD